MNRVSVWTSRLPNSSVSSLHRSQTELVNCGLSFIDSHLSLPTTVVSVAYSNYSPRYYALRVLNLL